MDSVNECSPKHWPDVRRFADVRECGAHNLERVDIICGGFPCQDVSSNNQYKLGVEGHKSSLFREALRLVGELRPRYMLLENVSDLLVRGLGTVLGELADVGYDAEWECIPTAAFGLPQPRWRVFIVAHPCSSGFGIGDERLETGPFASAWLDCDGLAEAEHRASQAAGLVRGMDDGLSGTVDRVAALGNAVSPQVAEWIFRQIAQAEGLRLQGHP